MTDPSGPTREQLGWLRSMIADYIDGTGFDLDDDPLSGDECVRECTALADALDRMLPPVPSPVMLQAGQADAEIPY